MTDQYEKKDCIGRGAFGEVYKGKELETGKIVALKLVDLEAADEEIEIIQREINVMSQISNPYVVQYYTSQIKGSTLWIVMEYMSGGSLKELLDAVGPFPEEAIATVMKALCRGLDYVHKSRKVHRDIKAANILLSSQGDVKLADFGVAGQMTHTMRQRNTVVGSPYWMAPEVIQESLYDETADIWSTGITGLELAYGLPPYANELPTRSIFLISKNEPPRVEGNQFSKSFKDFIALCLKKNPAERASAEVLLGHAFLRKARTSSVKELLQQKGQHDGSVEEKVIVGGDTFRSDTQLSSDTNPGLTEPSTTGTSSQDMSKLWNFDLGTAGDSEKEVTSNHDTPVQSSDSIVKVDMKEKPSDIISKEDKRLDHVSLVPNAVLAELILPVISQIRAEVDINKSHNEALISSLGALEVAFNDTESAQPGISAVLLEAMITEAITSKNEEVKKFTERVLSKSCDGT